MIFRRVTRRDHWSAAWWTTTCEAVVHHPPGGSSLNELFVGMSLPGGQTQAFPRPSGNACLGCRSRSHRSPARRSSRPMDAADGSPPQRPHFSSNYSKKMLVVGPGNRIAHERFVSWVSFSFFWLRRQKKGKRRQRKRNLVHSSVGGQRFPVFSVPGESRQRSARQATHQATRQTIPASNWPSDRCLVGGCRQQRSARCRQPRRWPRSRRVTRRVIGPRREMPSATLAEGISQEKERK